MKFIKSVACSLLAGVTGAIATAQTQLNDFSAFVQADQTFFVGGWSAGDDVNPLAGFTQNAGSFSLVGGTNADTAYVDYYFASALDLTGLDSLALTATRLADNTASTIYVSLLDGGQNVATAAFDLAAFNLVSGTTATAALTPVGGFAFENVIGFRITGGDVAGGSMVSVTLDSLAATSAVPEPSTYGAAIGAIALAGAAFRRRRAGARS